MALHVGTERLCEAHHCLQSGIEAGRRLKCPPFAWPDVQPRLRTKFAAVSQKEPSSSVVQKDLICGKTPVFGDPSLGPL